MKQQVGQPANDQRLADRAPKAIAWRTARWAVAAQYSQLMTRHE